MQCGRSLRILQAVGYAESDLRLGRKSSFQTIMIGHAANYLSPGVFQSSEQLAFTGSGRYRDFLNDETTNEVGGGAVLRQQSRF